MKNLRRLYRYRVQHPLAAPGYLGDEYNGAFRVPVGDASLLVIASNELGWDHVSVSLLDRCPTWDEMKAIKEMFFDKDEWAIEYHPPPAKNLSLHPFCLHLWRPQAEPVPVPAIYLV